MRSFSLSLEALFFRTRNLGFFPADLYGNIQHKEQNNVFDTRFRKASSSPSSLFFVIVENNIAVLPSSVIVHGFGQGRTLSSDSAHFNIESRQWEFALNIHFMIGFFFLLLCELKSFPRALSRDSANTKESRNGLIITFFIISKSNLLIKQIINASFYGSITCTFLEPQPM